MARLGGLEPLVEQAWQQAYLDPRRALEIGRQIVERGGADAVLGYGWLHVALAEVRVGDAAVAADALLRARPLFDAAGDRRGSAWCDEVDAILLRRARDYAGAERLQGEIDARNGLGWTDHDRFVGHNSRAITQKLLGRPEPALRHFYAALEAARATGWTGPVITALGNLGGYHHDLFNLEDARELCEQALQAGRAAGARQAVATTAANLIVIYHTAAQPALSRAMAEFLVASSHELLPGAAEHYPLALALAALDGGDVETAQRYLERDDVSPADDGDGLVFRSWLQARCRLQLGDPGTARMLIERALASRAASGVVDQPYELMQLHRTAADACERTGDLAAALAFTRRAHALYEDLVGRSARARWIALQVSHDLASAQRDRDVALRSQRMADEDRRRLAELNRALEAKIAETELLHGRLREQAFRDPLTGLHNRRHLFEAAPGLIELARRQGAPLCVVLLDLDHFKALNDTYGHDAGDAVLQRFAGLLTQTLRRSNVVCRHGGEEFVAVMPDIGADGAQVTLQRLLDACRGPAADGGDGTLPACSFSAGLAVFPAHGGTLDQLLTRADRALYAAKKGGRARIEQARQSLFTSLDDAEA